MAALSAHRPPESVWRAGQGKRGGDMRRGREGGRVGDTSTPRTNDMNGKKTHLLSPPMRVRWMERTDGTPLFWTGLDHLSPWCAGNPKVPRGEEAKEEKKKKKKKDRRRPWLG
jgi:hypothetical protein